MPDRTPSSPRHGLVALGEALVDISPLSPDTTLDDGSPLRPAPGGAPANVAVAASRLGADSWFLGSIGDDPFGRLLRRTLADSGVDVSGLVTVPTNTAVAFVSLSADADREFVFYGRPAAHDELTTMDVESFVAKRPFTREDVLHLGSNCLARGRARDASLLAVELAGNAGAAVSVDVNLRLDLWDEPTRAVVLPVLEPLLRAARLVKLSADELEFITGGCGQTEARSLAERLLSDSATLVCVTLGEGGAWYFTTSDSGHVAAFAVEARDTTGAGDAFAAAVAVATLRDPDVWRTREGTEAALRAACGYAAMSTTLPGAIPSYGSSQALEEFLAARSDTG